ncbi:MAG: aminotransferase class III-fold pyridoxal phosphate-dependent enzyme, partial [Saprospiraceae bacterium]
MDINRAKPDQNLIKLLEQRAKDTPDRFVYHFLAEGVEVTDSLSYKDLRQKARKIATHLQNENLKGERALLLYPSSLDFIVAFFACLYAGVIAVPAFPPRRNRLSARIKGILNDAAPKIILTCQKTKIDNSSSVEYWNSIPILVTDDKAALKKIKGRLKLPVIEKDTLAFLQYTSGSTGAPKGVMVSHQNIISNVHNFKVLLDSQTTDAMISWLPIFHDLGLILGILHPFYADFPSYVFPPSIFIKSPVKWLQAVSRYKGTYSGAPNFAYDLCIDLSDDKLEGINLEHWQSSINGAEPIRAETVKRFYERFKAYGLRKTTMLPGYGMAENTLYATGVRAATNFYLLQNGTDAYQSEFVGCGIAAEDSEIVIHNATTNLPQPDYEVGEILIKGGSVALGYWQKEAATKATFHNYLANGDGPYLKTGDLGLLINGELFVTGRIKDLIIIGGKNVYPQDIELTVEQSHPDLEPNAGAAFSVLTEEGEKLIVLQEIKRSCWRTFDGPTIIKAVQKSIAEVHELGAHAIILIKPHGILKTSSGKIQRAGCKLAFQKEELESLYSWSVAPQISAKTTSEQTKVETPVAPSPSEMVEPKFDMEGRMKTTKNWLSQKVGALLSLAASELDPSEPLSYFGMNSIKLTRLAGEIEEWLNVDFSPTVFYDYTSINAIAKYICEELSEANITPISTATPQESNEQNTAQNTFEKDKDIAVIGLACRFPGAKDIASFWELLLHKKNGIQDILGDEFSERKLAAEMEDLSEPYQHLKMGGYLNTIDTFDPAFFNISPAEAKSMDPQQRLLLELCWEALEEAGLTQEEIKNEKVGVFIGISTNEYLHLQTQSPTDNSVYLGTGTAGSIAANRISYVLNIKGPSMAIDTACSSSIVAVHQACQSILNGDCHTAIVGGVNLILTPAFGKVFSEAGMISEEGKSRPFDEKTNGYVRGEGGGVLILRSKTHAQTAADHIYALIKGSAINQDGKSNGLTAPSGLAQQEVITAALQNANLSPEQVSYIETHGTGTPLGDPIEFNALQSIYGKRSEKNTCFLGAVKSNIGHLEAAAGIAGLIKTVLVLNHKQIPPNINLTEVNARINLADSIFEFPQKIEKYDQAERIAAISSFGFGGTNSHLLMANAPVIAKTDSVDLPSQDFHLLTISAKSPAALTALVERYIALFASVSEEEVAAICMATNQNRTHFAYRLALTGDSVQSFADQLKVAVAKAPKVKRTQHKDLQGLFLFGGQGSQYPGMSAQLYHTNSVFRACVEACDKLFSAELSYSVKDLLLTATAESNATLHIQPLVFTVEYALAKLWMSWNIMPEAVMGHSLGEYVAACITGVYDLKDACRLVAWRAKLMQEETTQGKMLTITASQSEVEKWIAGHQDQVSIAAMNTKEDFVVSGEADFIETLQNKLTKQGVKCKLLKVEQAFHSPLMQTMLPKFKEVLATVNFKKPTTCFISALTGKEVTNEIASAAYWLKHILAPVNFAEACATVITKEFDYCLEVSPHPILTNALIANGIPFIDHIYPSLHRKATNWHTLFNSLGALYTSGKNINWKAVHQDFVLPRFTYLPKYPFQRESFWFEQHQNTAKPSHNHQPLATATAQSVVTKTVSSESIVTEELQNLFGELLGIPGAEMPLEIPLLEIGADSIVLIRGLKKIEQTYGVEISPRQIFENFPTLKSIAAEVAAKTTKTIHVPVTTPTPEVPQTATTVADHSNASMALGGLDGSLERLMTTQLNVLKDTIDKQLSLLQGNTNGKPVANAASVKETVRSAPADKNTVLSEDFKIVKYDTRLLEEAKPFTARQQNYIKELIQRFTTKTPSSRAYTSAYRPVLSDWINSIDFRKSLKDISYPILSERSDGARIWDKDGNEYIDLAIGYGVNFFGNKPAFVVEAIQAQLAEGFELAVQTDLAGEVATLISELTDSERVTFSNTGTEAVMAALRIARSVTQRRKVVLFNGYYHGTFDGNLAQRDMERDDESSIPSTSGTTHNFVKDILVLDPGSKKTLATIRQHQAEIAAIIVEPVQSRRPGIFPIAFLRELRALATELGIVLILDEIITGFRIHAGGAQALLNFKADITTYGKVLGGGMPIGVIAGKRKYLDTVDGGQWNFGDDSAPHGEMTMFGGTFCKHPLTLAAALATLKHIKAEGPALYERVNQLTEHFASEVNAFFNQLGIEIRVDNFGSLFRFQSNGKYNPLLRPIELDLFFRTLLDKGIYTWERRVCFLSTAHTEEDIQVVIRKIKETIYEMIDGGFFPEAKIDPDDEDFLTIKGAQPSYKKIPLLAVQQQLANLAKYSEEGSMGYNITTSLLLTGTLDIAALNAAFQEAVQRHESLRTVINADGLHQNILRELSVSIDHLTPETTDLDRSAVISQCLKRETKTAFDLQEGPLFRVKVLTLNETEQLLIFTGHHIIYDGSSAGIILKELAQRYSAKQQQIHFVEKPTVQFSDYIYQEQLLIDQKAFKISKAFWIDQFSQATTFFEFPADFERPKFSEYHGRRIRRQIAGQVKDQLISVGKQSGNTAFMTFLSVFAVLLYRRTGQNELLIGVPVDGRKGVEDSEMIGFGASILPLFISLEKDMSFQDVFTVVKKELFSAFEHRACSLPYFIREVKDIRELSNPGLISVVFNLDSNVAVPEFHGLETSLQFTPINYITQDFAIDLIDFEDHLQIECDYSTELYKKESIVDFLDAYEALIQEVSMDSSQPILDLDLAYWQNQLLDVEPLNLPVDFSLTNENLTPSATLTFPLDQSLFAAVTDLEKAEDRKGYDFLFAALKLTLHRYTAQDDICVGTNYFSANRGMIIPVRSNLSNNLEFNIFLTKLKQTIKEGEQHDSVNFEEVARALDRAADFYQVLFLLNATEPIDLAAQELTLGFNLVPTATNFSLEITYREDLFKA